MKNITLSKGNCVTVHTPNGKVVVGVDHPYNAEPVTMLYFGNLLNHTTTTVSLEELLAAYAEKETK
jgi:hypothetical protein